MKKLFLLMFAMCFMALSAYADRTISGQVLDAATGDPLIGATIQGEGVNHGTATDVDGHFTLVLPDHVKYVDASYVGYDSQQVAVSDNMVIRLKSNDQTLSEVVVTGYGSVKRAAFTGAASTLDGSVLEKKADVNFVKALEGS
ncbi:MAG: carboxypeptidase-like regulatory domain-containing protein, partial [Ruminococcus bromii]|nr:carboxypeptidase-like regulatory domain-containing protein [Ruminococcus bromii]